MDQGAKEVNSKIPEKWNAIDGFIASVRYREILKKIPLDRRDIVVCDIGCGIEGKFLCSIADRIAYGYGFDMKTEDLKLGNIELKQVDDLHKGIPLPDHSVDYVLLIAVLEHLSSPHIILSEIQRILKPDGEFILTTPTPLGKPFLEFMAFKLHVISEAEILDHKHYYTKKEIQNICCKCGLNVKNYRKFWFGMNSVAQVVKNNL